MNERRRPFTLETCLSLFAVFVAFGALAVTYLDFKASRDHNRLSMMPILQSESVFVPSDIRPYPGLFLLNHGTGIAIFDSGTIHVDGNPVSGTGTTMMNVIDATGLTVVANDMPVKYISTWPDAIPPGGSLPILWLNREDATRERLEKLRSALKRISISVQYHSVYGEEFEWSIE